MIVSTITAKHRKCRMKQNNHNGVSNGVEIDKSVLSSKIDPDHLALMESTEQAFMGEASSSANNILESKPNVSDLEVFSSSGVLSLSGDELVSLNSSVENLSCDQVYSMPGQMSASTSTNLHTSTNGSSFSNSDLDHMSALKNGNVSDSEIKPEHNNLSLAPTECQSNLSTLTVPPSPLTITPESLASTSTSIVVKNGGVSEELSGLQFNDPVLEVSQHNQVSHVSVTANSLLPVQVDHPDPAVPAALDTCSQDVEMSADTSIVTDDTGTSVVQQQQQQPLFTEGTNIYQTEDGTLIIQSSDGSTYQLQGAQGLPLETVQALLSGQIASVSVDSNGME